MLYFVVFYALFYFETFSLGLEKFVFWNVVLNLVALEVQTGIFVYCKIFLRFEV